MNDYKKYLELRLINGGLLIESLDIKTAPKNPVIKGIMESENIPLYYIKRGHNLANPVPYTLLSNMLTKLMGGVPVPTKPMKRAKLVHNLQRSKMCDELALNSYINMEVSYDGTSFDKTIVGSDGEFYHIFKDGKTVGGSEFIKTEKTAINSNVATKTDIMTFDSGEVKTMIGVYSMGMLLRAFDYNENHPVYKKLIVFINDILGVEDVTKTYTFNEMAQAIYDAEKDCNIANRVIEFVEGLREEWCENTVSTNYFIPWMDAIFNYDDGHLRTDFSANNKKTNCDSKDTTVKGKCFLRNLRGASHRICKLNGTIIVELTDPAQEEAIRNNAGFCSFLEGGVCEVVGIHNEEPYVNYKARFTKISNENPLQNTSSK